MRVNAARFSPVGVGVMLPILLLLVPSFYTTATVNAACCFGRWCRSYAAQCSAVSAAFYTTVRVNAARCFAAVGVGVMLPILPLFVPPFTLRRG